MAVGTGSIKRASNAAKAKAADNKEVKATVENKEAVVESATTEAKAEKKTAAKTTAKKTTTNTTKSTAKPAAKKTTTKTTTKKTTTKKVADEKKEKTYEVVEGITCNMPRYLL